MHSFDQHSAFKAAPDQSQHAPVIDLQGQAVHPSVMVNSVEELRQVDIHAMPQAAGEVRATMLDGLPLAAVGTEAEAGIGKAMIPQLPQNSSDGLFGSGGRGPSVFQSAGRLRPSSRSKPGGFAVWRPLALDARPNMAFLFIAPRLCLGLPSHQVARLFRFLRTGLVTLFENQLPSANAFHNLRSLLFRNLAYLVLCIEDSNLISRCP